MKQEVNLNVSFYVALYQFYVAAKLFANQAVGYTVLACGQRRTGRATCGRILKSVAGDGSG